jgi:hypothetical protein
MLGIQFIKASPTEYVLLFKNGKIKAQGAGLSFFYYAPSSSIVIVPAATADAPFIFKEGTIDFQEINIQGQFTYRVAEPVKLATLLDFTVDANGQSTGDGSEKLPARLTSLAQVAIREKLSTLTLRQALASSAALVEHAKIKLKQHEILTALGIELLDFAILKISPNPDMARALEASTRENLLKEADEAIYTRRNFAVEQERIIKENELQTQIAVEEKNRKIREEQMNIEIAVQEKQKLLEETKMNAVKAMEEKKNEIEKMKLESRIELEKKKKSLVETESENMIQVAKAKAESVRLELSALGAISGETLEILASNQMSASKTVSKAMRELAKNAGKIGNLNISPDLLSSLLNDQE